MKEGAINRQAIYSDGTDNFIIPNQPRMYETVKIRCRVGADDVEAVYLVVDNMERELYKEAEVSNSLFDYYFAHITLTTKVVNYYFKIKKKDEIVYWNKQGVVENPNTYFDFKLIPGWSTPDWAKGAVMYQIFVDRFYNGDKSNDVLTNEYSYINDKVHKVDDWNRVPATMDVREFYGGDLKGVLKKLDYLEELGVEVIYLNPIFVSPSNHKYDTQDYDHVDPHYAVIIEDGGEVLSDDDFENKNASKYIQRVVNMKNLEASNEFFAKFVEEVHERGMKVILDGVFNHCGSFNKWLDREKIYDRDMSYAKGAFLTEDSPYNSFFKFYHTGHWPDNEHYDSWWGNDTLPKLNYEESPELENYILSIAKKWVSPPYNVDGWRLDVAADLGHTEEYNHKFWRKFRDAVKSANPNAIILAEHYGDPSAWLDGSQWDTVMNYDAFMEPVSWFLTGMEKHSDVFKPELLGNAGEFFHAMVDFRARFTMYSLQVAMNELSNHDHSRFLTRTNHNVGRTAFAGATAAQIGVNPAVMRLAVLIQMTWDGAPTIYYGDEAGVCGWTDPDSRRTYPWGNEDKEMIEFHKQMIRIHKSYSCFKTGSLIFLNSEENLIAYGRFDKEEKAFTVVNVGGYERDVEIDAWRLGVEDGKRMVQLIETSEKGFLPKADMQYVIDGKVRVHLGAYGGMTWKELKI